MATGTRERSAGPDRILAGKRQKQNDVQPDDRDGSVLSQEHVDLARSENHAQDLRRYRWATLRIAEQRGTSAISRMEAVAQPTTPILQA